MTARQVRSNGAVAAHKNDVDSYIASSSPDTKHRRSFFLGKQRDSLPSYYSRSTNGGSIKGSPMRNKAFDISSPMSESKYAGGMGRTPELVAQPNLAHHPAMTGGHMI